MIYVAINQTGGDVSTDLVGTEVIAHSGKCVRETGTAMDQPAVGCVLCDVDTLLARKFCLRG